MKEKLFFDDNPFKSAVTEAQKGENNEFIMLKESPFVLAFTTPRRAKLDCQRGSQTTCGRGLRRHAEED